jgi:hypothetical protein
MEIVPSEVATRRLSLSGHVTMAVMCIWSEGGFVWSMVVVEFWCMSGCVRVEEWRG